MRIFKQISISSFTKKSTSAWSESRALPVHDGLKDWGERRDPDARADEERVLRVEYLAGGRPKGSVYVDVEGRVHLLDVQLLPLHATRPDWIREEGKIQLRMTTFP